MPERKGDHANVNQDRKKALVIGISDYDDLMSLNLCKNDADELSRVLEKQGYELTDKNKLTGRVTAKTMREAIYDFFNDDYVKPKDTLLFYFSGHGLPDGFGNHYLAASDTAKDKPGREAISFNDLEHWSESSRSKRIVTILDCCFSGAAGLEGVKGNDDVSVAQEARNLMDRRMKESEGIYLLASSLAYQQSVIKKDLGHSLFTYYLLEGLKGKDGYMDSYGHVTADHLHDYVLDRILGEPRQLQRPIKKAKASGDILVAFYPKKAKTGTKAGSNSTSTEFYLKMLEAERYEKMDDYDSAISCYEDAITIDPNYYPAHNGIGKALFQVGRYEDAIYAYKRAISSRPNHPDAYDLIGDVYFKLEDYAQALEWYNKALDIRPQSYEFLKDKGLVHYKLEEYEQAITLFDASLKIRSDQTVLQYKDDALRKIELKNKETGGIKQSGSELGKKPLVSTFKSKLNRLVEPAKKPLVGTFKSKLNQNKKSSEESIIQPNSVSPKEKMVKGEQIIPESNRSTPENSVPGKETVETSPFKSNDILEELDKKDPRYSRLYGLSPLKKIPKKYWYQKITHGRENKTSVFAQKYCPKCKKERRIYSNQAMKDAAWPDEIGECSVCNTLLILKK